MTPCCTVKASDVGLTVIEGAVPVMVMLSVALAVLPQTLVALKVKLKVPGRVGVPAIEGPWMLSPSGSLPAVTVNETEDEICPHEFALTVVIVC